VRSRVTLTDPATVEVSQITRTSRPAPVTGPVQVTGAGGADPSGRFAVGGLPDGGYTRHRPPGRLPAGITTANVTAGAATAVKAHITCSP